MPSTMVIVVRNPCTSNEVAVLNPEAEQEAAAEAAGDKGDKTGWDVN